MFISSNGSLSAGRKNRDNALFPYYTDDKIHDYAGITGSKTLVLINREGDAFLWEPFSKELAAIYRIERNIYKNVYGNKIVFEEINHELGLSFQYAWFNSEKFGFVKKSKVVNLNNGDLQIEILDGLSNLLPNEVSYYFQTEYSNLADAYKKNELVEELGLGLFSLSSIPVDRAEPSESLRATSVWSIGLDNPKILISNNQLANFRKGIPVQTEIDIRARRCAYYVNAEINLSANESKEWYIIAELNQDKTRVQNLSYFIKNEQDKIACLKENIAKGTENLIKIVAGADGLQDSNEELSAARHFSNTMFNVMRGGTYLKNYTIEVSDFMAFVKLTNTKLFTQIQTLLSGLTAEISHSELIKLAEKSGNADFIRVCNEYLPLTFSRRHGDPSRPWNQFSIEIKNEDGTEKSDFQGNWRDIFQNWEALSLSYPEFIENIISKFVNATTVDGYNPYRIMRSGIDWEAPDPEDPWAYIGYWGDHQIIYLQKLLELSNNYHPAKLDEMLTSEIFAYANVPYRIKNYSDIVKNPKDTIGFDHKLHTKIEELVEQLGADGRLLIQNNEIYKVNLTEKILVTLLSKLSNFVPEAGIWLNTQRPEWNDANNALVGNGVSMVTLYYLRRFLNFWNAKFKQIALTEITLSEEVKTLFDSIQNVFKTNAALLEKGFSDEERRTFTDVLGLAGEKYRNLLYANSFSGKKAKITTSELVEFTQLALDYCDQSIKVNKRADGLYHAYNLISFGAKTISIRYLYEMLEGQVSVLSAGSLSTQENLAVLDALKSSALFRKDQYSYILYPDRQLPRFDEKNIIPSTKVKNSKLLSKLIEDKNISIVNVDKFGEYHFKGVYRNAAVLEEALNSLNSEKYGKLVEEEKTQILAIYEELFDHQSFTGRSGTFYGYEGLGSIYWHMVSKLLLAVEECFFKATDEGASAFEIGRLKEHYFEIKAGIGLYKSPELYGAFPTDAYSHTPGGAGAKQPGMTGQVKEDVIARMGELGIRVANGEIHIDTKLINHAEFLAQANVFTYFALNGTKKQIQLNKGQLAFTVCQVPVVYTLSDKEQISISLKNGQKKEMTGNVIDKETCKSIFGRTNEVELIEIAVK